MTMAYTAAYYSLPELHSSIDPEAKTGHFREKSFVNGFYDWLHRLSPAALRK
jgi:hypothetical protein